jgi:hypothetical protein
METSDPLPNVSFASWDGLLIELWLWGFGFIVDEDVLRVVDREHALEFWREWWGSQEKK